MLSGAGPESEATGGGEGGGLLALGALRARATRALGARRALGTGPHLRKVVGEKCWYLSYAGV